MMKTIVKYVVWNTNNIFENLWDECDDREEIILTRPNSYYEKLIFDESGYDSFEDAVKAIDQINSISEYVVLPVVIRDYCPEEE